MRVLERLGRDCRTAGRAVLVSWRLSLLMVVTIALGVGANTAMFSVVRSTLLRPIPVQSMDRLVMLYDEIPRMNLRRARMPAGEVLDLAADKRAFDRVAGFTLADQEWIGSDGAARVSVASTLGDYFALLGVSPAAGRFYATDARDGDPHTVVLSFAFWQNAFGGDPRAVGSTMTLDSTTYRIVGVAPADVRYPWLVDLWKPVALVAGSREAIDRGTNIYTTIARLRPGTSLSSGRAMLKLAVGEWTRRFGAEWYPESYHRTVIAVPLAEALSGTLRPLMLTLAAAVSLLLLMACVNVAGIQTVRAATRQREVAIRLALGADASIVARERLLETAIVTLLGGAAAIGSAFLMLRAILHSDAANLPILQQTVIGPAVLGFLALACTVTAAIFGTMPVLGAVRIEPTRALGGARTATSGVFGTRFLHAAVLVQLALATVLVVGAIVVTESLVNLIDVDPGFHATRVLTAQTILPRYRYQTAASKTAFRAELLARLRATPGFEHAALTSGLPMSESGTTSLVRVPGLDQTGEHDQRANVAFIDGDYFRAMGIPLRAGRTFSDADVPGSLSVVVDENLVRRFFPNENPIGKRIALFNEAEIIGVVGAVKKRDLSDASDPAVYFSFRQAPSAGGTISIVASGSFDDAQAQQTLRAVLRGIDARLPLTDIATMAARVSRSTATQRFATGLLAAFAAVSLILAVLGIHGVLSYTTAQRRRELAIRIALGAQPRDVVRVTSLRGLAVAGIGLGIGGLIAALAVRAAASFVFGVNVSDARPILAAIALLAGAVALATWMPIRRAIRTDPADVLRDS